MSSKFDVNERLDEAKDRGVGVNMAVPLHERIDQLCDVVYAAGNARPSKRKMLSALVLGSPTDAAELMRLISAYDGACVGDALVTAEPDGNVVEFPRRASGPRPRPSR